MKKRRKWLTLLLLLLFLGGTYSLYRAVRTPPALKKVRELQTEMASSAAQNWTPEQRQAKFQEMRSAMQDLSPSQRDTLAAERQQRQETEMQRYAQMSPTEKVRYLDEQINRSERARQQFAAQGPQGGQRPATQPPGTNAGGPPGSRGGGTTPEQREQRRKEALDRTTPEYRALRDQFRKDMENRRKQRGLTR